MNLTHEEAITLFRFKLQMEIELKVNKHKGSFLEWKGIGKKITDLEYHKAKMLIAIRVGDMISVKEYIADCANILMAMGHELGVYDNSLEDTDLVSELKEDVFNHVPRETPKIENNYFDQL